MSSRNVLDIKKAAARRAEARQAPSSHGPKAPKAVRLKTRRRRQRIIAFCICILCAAGVTGGLGAATHLQQLAVRDISVTGVQALPAGELAAAATQELDDNGFRLFSRENMFLYPRRAIEEVIATQFPRVKDVSVARTSLLATAVVITVKERDPFATWCTGSDCYLMDSSGFIFGPAGETPSSAYIFRGGLAPGNPIGQTFLRGRIAGIFALLHELEKENFKAAGITVDSEKDFTITLESGLTLMVSFEMQPGDIIRNLQTALESDGLREKLDTLQYIDLRFGNRVYYK